MKARTTRALALLATGLVLAGCGRGTDGAAEKPKDVNTTAQATGKLNVWAMGTEGEALDAFAKKFESANPGIEITVTPIGWDVAHDKIISSVAGRSTPDISMIGSTWMGELAKSGAVDPTPGNLIDKAAFFPGAWSTVDVDGTAWGVPWYVETRVLYYRKDLAAKAGVKPPATWEESKTFVKGLKKAGAGQGMQINYTVGSWQELLPLVWQQGGSINGPDGGWTFDTPEMVKALERTKSYFDEGLSTSKVDPASFPASFFKGEVGAFHSGPWMIAGMEKDGGDGFAEKFDVAPYAKGPAGGTSFIGGSDLVVFKDSGARDAAWKFVKWLTEPETQAAWFDTVKALPSVQAAWQRPELTADPRVAVFGEQLKDAKTPPPVPTWEQVAKAIEQQIERVVRGKTTPAEAAKAIQSRAETVGTGL
ncbi:sugar ABC transporter substrate-binding protein [Sphaerisporangium rufum]|uniref:Sugar ABC transporter substrate-binding protein n=1 Tax=Sphaerisporangium rufum TaxID=1381558 RepID=A0A919R5X6_9ACTN|nr:extracellular solute-binding protein [Sphaerisporangium rufum]GII80286.1 sugar ABC transporter substrate-binding protein [Sphaerisporangium rufum]